MKVLVAYDGSPSSEAAVTEVILRPWEHGTQVRLVTVIEPTLPEPPPSGLVYWPLLERMRSAVREEAYQRCQQALARFAGRLDLEASYELREGTPKDALLDAIREWGPDLVITGCRGTTGLERLFLGSVSHALVTHAPCSVEVVKRPSRAAA